MARDCATSPCFPPIAWIISTISASLILLYFSLTPEPPYIGAGLFEWDKLQHAVSLGVMAFITVRLCLALRVSLLQATIIGFLYATLLGGIIELLQGMVTTHRQADILDLVADASGAFIVVSVHYFYANIKLLNIKN